MTAPLQLPLAPDRELAAVADELLAVDRDGTRIARVLRRTYDMLLNGKDTGRYRWDQPHKTENTYFGTLVEINLQREFGFADGKAMDFAICGIDVDCKFSQKLADWMIPPETLGHILLDDATGKWSLGLVRATPDVLTTSDGNRDRKRWLSKFGKTTVDWSHWNHELPENALLRIPAPQVDRILNCSPHGTKRIDMLFRLAQRRRISRAAGGTT